MPSFYDPIRAVLRRPLARLGCGGPGGDVRSLSPHMKTDIGWQDRTYDPRGDMFHAQVSNLLFRRGH